MGRTEEIIGTWLAADPSRRDKVILATKVAGPTPANFIPANREKTLTGDAAPSAPLPRLVPDQIERALAASLVRLKTTYVDLYQLHWPDRYTPLWGFNQYKKEMEGKHSQQPRAGPQDAADWDAVVACMGSLIERGLIRAWGLSNESTFGVCKWHAIATRLGVPPPVSIQNDFSLLARPPCRPPLPPGACAIEPRRACTLAASDRAAVAAPRRDSVRAIALRRRPQDRRFESELAEACSDANLNLGLLAYGPLNGGTLSGKYAGGARPEGARHVLFPQFQGRYWSPRALEAADEYAAIAAKHGLTPAQLALGWAYSRFYMGAVIIGATTLEQLEENVKAAEVTLPAEALKAIDAVHMRIRNPNLRD